jgi:hypothetical protein
MLSAPIASRDSATAFRRRAVGGWLQWGMENVEPDRGRRHRAAWHGKAAAVLAVVFTAAAAGCLVLVVLDLWVGRPAAGDLYLAGLNAGIAAVFWRWRSLL